MGAPPQTPELAGSWLIYCLPCSVRLGVTAAGRLRPCEVGGPGSVSPGGLFWKKCPCGFFAVDPPWGSPNECPVLQFPGALGASASMVWPEPQLRARRPAVGSLCGRSPQTRLQRALPRCQGGVSAGTVLRKPHSGAAESRDRFARSPIFDCIH